MKQSAKEGIQWIIAYVTILHLIWGTLLLIDFSTFSTNPIGFFEYFFNKTQTSIAFLSAGICAVIAYKLKERLIRFVLLIPQLLLLLLTSMSGILSSIRGQYVDGVDRPHLFIFADQLPVILLSIIYGLAIYDKVLRDNNG